MPDPVTLLADTAADLMSPGPVSLPDTATAADAAAFLTARGFGAAVVIDPAGHPVGVVTKTDLLVHARGQTRGLEADRTAVRGLMTPAVFSLKADTPARAVVSQFLVLNVHHLFVADEAGVLIGVISPVDVLKRLG